MKMLSVDLNEAYDLMAAVVVRHLGDDFKWTPSQIEAIADKALDAIMKKMENEDILQVVAKNAAMMHAGGASDKSIKTMANASFAIIAVKIAEGLHRSRVAELN